MIELNKKTQQDFLSREWVLRLLDAGVDMSDAKYCIIHFNNRDADFVMLKSWIDTQSVVFWDNFLPTYTTAELMYKLWEWDKEYGSLFGELKFLKDAPFYIFYYKNNEKETLCSPLYYPILSLAQLLIQCMKKGIGCVKDISDK